MKTAIILNGFVRTWDRVIGNFVETFAYMKPYVFVTTYNKQYGYHPHIKNLTKVEEDHYLTDEYIQKLFEPINPRVLIIEDADILDEKIELEKTSMAPSMRDITNGFGQFRKQYLICSDIQQYEEDNGFKFDRIIKTRCDLMYPEVVNFDIAEDEVLVDSGNVFPNDCFIMAHRDHFLKISESCFNQFYFPKPDSHEEPPHRVLKNAIDETGAEIIKRKVMKSVMRVTGEQVY